jgi:hypothetical protein
VLSVAGEIPAGAASVFRIELPFIETEFSYRDSLVIHNERHENQILVTGVWYNGGKRVREDFG